MAGRVVEHLAKPIRVAQGLADRGQLPSVRHQAAPLPAKEEFLDDVLIDGLGFRGEFLILRQATEDVRDESRHERIRRQFTQISAPRIRQCCDEQCR
ncbi:MAG: hypothetical protein R3E97_19585 [Candidatus Eisenbacteria bacterium]